MTSSMRFINSPCNLPGSFLSKLHCVGAVTAQYRGHLCLQNGVHYLRFLVDGSWQVSAEMPTTTDADGIPCNVLTVHARENFALYYNTSWKSCEMRYRILDRDGVPLGDVRPLSPTASPDVG